MNANTAAAGKEETREVKGKIIPVKGQEDSTVSSGASG